MKRTGEERTGDVAPTPAFRVPVVGKILTWILVIAMVVHTVMVGLWVAPSTPFRDAVGQERVREYINPWFEQNWSLFAPTPRRGEVMFEVRAFVVDQETGGGRETEWAKLTDIEDALVRGDIAPPRTMKLTRRTADNLHGARADMNQEQVELLDANFFETPIEELRRMLLEVEGGHAGAVDRYMRADETATLIANAYAEITWGDQGEIARVQYRSSSARLPAFDPESDATLADIDPNVRTYGWRHRIVIPEDQLELFAHYALTEVD